MVGCADSEQSETKPDAGPAPPPPVVVDTPQGILFGTANPVIYLNDESDDVYVEGYVYALGSNREIDLRGIITSGVDCTECVSGGRYSDGKIPERRAAWIEAARASGFAYLPDQTLGTQGARLEKPASGRVEETSRIGSPGSDLLVREAMLATPELPLLVVSGGPITTLADAYLAQPDIAERVVVSWLVGTSSTNLEGWNATIDPWATEIVLRSFRVFVAPLGIGTPEVPLARLSELPDKPLRKLLLSAGRARPGFDLDGPAALIVRLPAFALQVERSSYVAPTMEGLSAAMQSDPAGNLYVLTDGNGAAGSEEFFRGLRKAHGLPFAE